MKTDHSNILFLLEVIIYLRIGSEKDKNSPQSAKGIKSEGRRKPALVQLF